MKKNITINGEQLEYSLNVSKKAKYMRLAVYADNRVVVTVPRFIPEFLFKRFIISKSEWLFKKLNYFKNTPHGVHLKSTRKDYLQYKEQTRELVTARLNYFNQYYNLKWNQISIKNTKSRWGSCSSKKNLNFSYKLALLDKELADYIIVHELCHLQEMNHSREFWGLVSRVVPHYKILRKKLRAIH